MQSRDMQPDAQRIALIVEDDPTFGEVMLSAVHQLFGGWQAVLVRSGAEATEWLESGAPAPALALVDLGLPDVSGIDVISQLRARCPDIPILVVSVISAERSVLAAIRAGARGYILKDESVGQIAEALEQALLGNYPISPALARYLFKLAGAAELSDGLANLTPKELELLRHLARGRTYAEAGQEMGVAISTVQTHIRNLYRKLDVHSQVQAVTKAQDRGLI